MSIDVVEDITPRIQYTAFAAQTAFDYPFPIFADTDLVVYRNSVQQAITDDYTVSGVGEDGGGTVTFVAGLTVGDVVTIYRETTIERITDFQQNGPNRSAALNDEFDRITVIEQELRDAISRCLRLSPLTTASSTSAELSPIDSWLNKFVYINNSGVPEPASVVAAAVSRSILGSLLYPQTAEELAASVTPTDYAYPPGNVLRYGADPTGVADSTAAFNKPVSCGYKVFAPKGYYKVTNVAVVTGMHIEGEKVGASLVTRIMVGTNSAAAFRLATGSAYYVTLENLHIMAASGVTNARGYLQDDKSTYTAYAHFTNVSTDISLLVSYEGFFITTQWQNCMDGYVGTAPGGQQHQFITSLPAAFGQANQTNLCTVTDCKVFGATSGTAAAIDIGWGGRWTFSGGCDFEALSTRAIRARGILGGAIRDCWFENINPADYCVYFDSISGQGCGKWEISDNEIVLYSLTTGSGFMLPNAVSVIARSNTAFGIPASKTLVHPSYLANVTLIDNAALSGLGAAGFINKVQEGESGTFTITATGLAGTVTGTGRYTYSDGCITLETPAISGTSNAATFTLTGIPVAARPLSSKGNFVCLIFDNSVAAFGSFDISTGGVMSFRKSATATGSDWTGSGTKLAGATTTTYSLLS